MWPLELREDWLRTWSGRTWRIKGKRGYFWFERTRKKDAVDAGCHVLWGEKCFSFSWERERGDEMNKIWHLNFHKYTWVGVWKWKLILLCFLLRTVVKEPILYREIQPSNLPFAEREREREEWFYLYLFLLQLICCSWCWCYFCCLAIEFEQSDVLRYKKSLNKKWTWLIYLQRKGHSPKRFRCHVSRSRKCSHSR